MAKKKATPVDQQMDVETAVVDNAVETPVERRVVTGKVFNCSLLNVRKRAKIDSDIVATLNRGTTVTINLDKSTSDFYSISTANGINGFCVKNFIKTP